MCQTVMICRSSLLNNSACGTAGFLGELDVLCKEETLVGTSRITLELRPLAYSMLAELVHHVRSELTMPQLSRIIYLFCRSLGSPGPPFDFLHQICNM